MFFCSCWYEDADLFLFHIQCIPLSADSIIKVRNKLVHPKTSIKTFKIKDSKIKFPFGLNLPQEYYENVGIQSLVSISDFTPIEYHEALDKLEKWFFSKCPDRLKKVEMVIATN